MALFRFRVRNAGRDLRTDAERFGRLGEELDRLRREITDERDGLKARHDASVGDAAFAQQALEDGRADARLSERVEALTRALIDYDRRMHALDGQIVLLDEMAARLDTVLSGDVPAGRDGRTAAPRASS